MTVEEFLRTRPCLEEIEGFLWSLRWQIENPDLMHRVQYPELTSEILGPIYRYRADLMKGREIPAPTRLNREWEYAKKRAPRKKPGPPPSSLFRSPEQDEDWDVFEHD